MYISPFFWLLTSPPYMNFTPHLFNIPSLYLTLLCILGNQYRHPNSNLSVFLLAKILEPMAMTGRFSPA